MDIRNEIKAYIVREGMTMSEVVERLAEEYGWSESVPNLSGKLRRGSLRYGEAVELANVLGYQQSLPNKMMTGAALRQGGAAPNYCTEDRFMMDRLEGRTLTIRLMQRKKGVLAFFEKREYNPPRKM